MMLVFKNENWYLRVYNIHTHYQKSIVTKKKKTLPKEHLRKSIVIHHEYSIHTLCPLIIYATPLVKYVYCYIVFLNSYLYACTNKYINYSANAPTTNKKVDMIITELELNLTKKSRKKYLNKKLIDDIGIDDLYHKASNT